MTETFHLMHASGKFNADPDVIRRGLREMYRERGADAVVHTEYGKPLATIAREEAKAAGYGRIVDLRGGSVIVLSKDFKNVVGSFADAVPAFDQKARFGGHGPRGVLTAEGDWRGDHLAISTFHGLAGSGFDAERLDQTLRIVHELGEVTRRNSRGRDLTLWTSDTNVDEDDPMARRYLAALAEHGLISCWEERGEELPTHGRRTIDVVGSVQRDRRVALSKVKVWPEVRGFDHKQVSGWYDIRGRAA